MGLITKQSEKLGLTNKGTYDTLIDCLTKHDLPYTIDDFDIEELLGLAKLDKKNLNNKLNLILLKDIGECYIHSVDYSEFIDMMGDV